jgi:dTMP kinase
MSRGRWIALDGIEACGKSTQVALLAERLGAVATREPGGTAVGAGIRQIVLDPEHPELSDRSEVLLYAADRAQHVAEVVAPALARGQHVVADRSWASTLAYQGFGRRLDLDEIDRINRWAMDGRLPDLVVLLRIPVEEAMRRLGRDRDRLEREDEAFHRRVADGFERLAGVDPQRWVVVDGMGTVDDVAARVADAVTARTGLPM